jgi:hypothetical protein
VSVGGQAPLNCLEATEARDCLLAADVS